MSKVITLIVLGFIAYYWAMTQKLKNAALRAAKMRCRDAGVQLLDHTVVQYKVRLSKDTLGRRKLEREYRFDFTSTGEHRYHGKVIIQGKHVVATELEAYSIN